MGAGGCLFCNYRSRSIKWITDQSGPGRQLVAWRPSWASELVTRPCVLVFATAVWWCSAVLHGSPHPPAPQQQQPW